MLSSSSDTTIVSPAWAASRMHTKARVSSSSSASSATVVSGWYSCTSVLRLLDQRGDALADADAHRRQAQARSWPAAELVDERRDQARAGAAERMPKRDRATVDVQPVVLGVELEFAADAKRL